MAEIKKEKSGAENYQEPGILFKATPVLIAFVFLVAVAYFAFPSEAERDTEWMAKSTRHSAIDINNPGCAITGPDGKKIDLHSVNVIPKGSTVPGECFNTKNN